MLPQRRRRILWWLAIGVILAVTLLPLSNYRPHAHWDKIVWWPRLASLGSPGFLANVLLFLPFGLACPWSRRPQTAVLTGCLLSVIIELSQVYTHNRIPAVDDVVANTLGAAAGVWLLRRLTREAVDRPRA